MSAGGPGAIGPVSVRYAAQIRELLFAHAMLRMAADQEAARASADADRTARTDAARNGEQDRQRVQPRITDAAPVKAAEPPTEPGPAATSEPGHLVDLQA